MKKKFLSLFVLMIVAFCGIVFAACGQAEGADVSISIVSGLDSQLDQTQLSAISSELLLTDFEQENLKNGNAYNATVTSANAISLVVGQNGLSSREIIFQVEGADSSKIYLSSDSSAISISSVESVGSSKFKATVSALNAGTAEIVASTGKNFTSTVFVVKAIEKPTSFSAKQSTIYLEKGKTLDLSSSNLFTFLPSSTNLREVEFYDGETCLSKDGKTILATEENENATGIISSSREITAKALRLSGNASVQTISVVVVDNISSISMNKLVYSKNASQEYEEKFETFEQNQTLTAIRNVTSGEVNYGVRQLYVVVDCLENNLDVVSSATVSGATVVLSEKEHVTHENAATAKFASVVDTSRQTFSTWVFKFEFKFEGINEYGVELSFKAGEYVFDQKLEFNVAFKSASSLVELKRENASADETRHIIYDSYSGSYGTKFFISTNQSDEIAHAKLILGVDQEKIVVLNSLGKQIDFDNNSISFSNNQAFFVKAVKGFVGTINATVCVSYTFEGVEFQTQKEVEFVAVPTPTDFVFKNSDNELKKYVFDLNTSGQIVGEMGVAQAYSARNTLTLDLVAIVKGGAQNLEEDYIISTTSNIAQIVKNNNSSLTITALSTGTASFKVTTGNGLEKEFSFEVIKSVSSATVSLPSQTQNSNIISIITNYEHENGTTYNQFAIVKKNTLIPLVFDATGNVSKIELESNANISLKSGKVIAKAKLDEQQFSIKITYQFVNGSGEIEEKTVYLQKFLLTSITKIENLEFKATNGTSFELYDYSTVGYHSKSLSTTSFTINVWPSEIKDVLKSVTFSSNVSSTESTHDKETGIATLKTDLFELEYSNGVGTIFCNVKNQETLKQFENKKIAITASISQQDGQYSKTIQFSIKQATPVELITSTVSEINLDKFTDEVKINVSTYPADATNHALIYEFVPNSGRGLSPTDVEIKQEDDGSVTIKLNDKDKSGEGKIVISAADSYSSSSLYTTYIEIPLAIADGSEKNPYVINFASDLEKMTKTEFSSYYLVNGEIDLAGGNFNYKNAEGKTVVPSLTGSITGKNNAKFKNISISLGSESTQNYGLFSEISAGGKISDVGFEFKDFELEFELKVDVNGQTTERTTATIGLLAGTNSGTLTNVSVTGNISVSINNGNYELSIGGVCGTNNGTITNTISKTSQSKLFEGNITFTRTQQATKEEEESINKITKDLYVGAITGYLGATGTISRKVEDNLIEANNAFATACFTITIIDENSYNSGRIGIGGIAGYFNQTGENGIKGCSAIGKITAKNMNNVGGIVGLVDYGIIDDCLAQVELSGKENVGGAIGWAVNGTFTSLIVEHIKKENSGVLISGNKNVGGIIGYFSKGTLTSSSFISYLSKDTNDNDIKGSEKVGRIVGVTSTITIENDNTFTINNITYTISDKNITNGDNSKTIPIKGDNSFEIEQETYYILDKVILQTTTDFVVAIAEIGIPVNDNKFKLNEDITYTIDTEDNKIKWSEDDEVTITDNKFTRNGVEYTIIYDKDGKIIRLSYKESTVCAKNYAVYSRGDGTTTVCGGSAKKDNSKESKTKTDLKETDGFKFIFLPQEDINVELSETAKQVQMTTDSSDGPLAFYLFLHEGANISDEIEKNNTTSITYWLSSTLTDAKIQRLTIKSDNENILQVDNNGNFVAKGQGVATLTITSPYVYEKSQKIYVYVTRYVDDFEVCQDSSFKLNLFDKNSAILDAQESQLVYFNFLKLESKVEGYSLPNNIKVLFKIGNKLVKAGEDQISGIAFNLIKIDANCYQIAVHGQTATYNVSIVPYFEFEQGGKIYSSYSATSYPVTSNNNQQSITNVNDLIKSNHVLKFENTTKAINVSKDKIQTQPFYETQVDVSLDSIKKDETVSIDISGEGEADVSILEWTLKYNNNLYTKEDITSLTINCSKNNKFSLTFKIKEDERDLFSKEQCFKITIQTSNGVSKQINVAFQPQTLISASTLLYPIISNEQQSYNFEGSFSYISRGSIVPGQHSLIELVLTPSFTAFETIEIYNSQSNEYPLVFDLFSRESNSVLTGAKSTQNGIIIERSLLQNGVINLRTFADERLADNSTSTIYIVLKDKNGNQIGEKIEKTFYVEHLPGVILTIDGVSSGNTTSLKLAKGLEYDIDLWVKGYQTGSYSNTGAIITDGQIVMEISNQKLATIQRDSTGQYKLVVSKEALGEKGARELTIKTYGINSKGEKSREVELKIEIVEFVVKPDAVGDIISGAVDGVYSSATGNSLELEISLNSNMLKYDVSDVSVVENVRKFLESLSTEGNWTYKDFGQSYVRYLPLKDGIETQAKVFKISLDETTKKFTISFKKLENSSLPTFEIKFDAKFYYNENGVPTLAGDGQQENLFTLGQSLRFDISEKTTLRNPYPITSVEQLSDLREGNYYILLNDITLPANFEPITTQIGGFDGNNHKIYLTNSDYLAGNSSSCEFGLFESTSEDAIIKNVILCVKGHVDINLYDYTTVTAGLLVGENNGKITNCSIEKVGSGSVSINIFGDATTAGTNTVGGLVGINNGDITNSRVKTDFFVNASANAEKGSLPANVGGISGINNGNASISSCFVNARIENNTAGSLSALTGGITSQNEVGAKIFATYISGDETFPNEEEFKSANAIVYSTASAGAFVHTNSGQISNCFANIPVRANTGASGFAYKNLKDGTITHSFSSCALESLATNSAFIGVLAGVSHDEDPILNKGTLVECYCWVGDGIESGHANTGLASNEGIEGLKCCKAEAFGKDKGETFKKYAFTNTTNKADGVWFWANENSSETEFVENEKPMNFSHLIPQLVSPNLIATGSQKLEDEKYDEETQTTTYIYEYENSKYQEGSKFNPYIIASEEDLEFIVSRQSGFSSANTIGAKYFRLVGDIIYETSVVSSGMFKYAFLGNLEGNSYTIGNYVLDSAEELENGGFFRSVGTLTNQIGTIKNITFAPRYMSLTNCKSVGAVAGAAYGATFVNINVDGKTYSSGGEEVTIIGKNIVGGIVGKAEGAFNFNNLTAIISVNATYRSSLNYHEPQLYLQSSTDKISYAGVIAGVLSGYGVLTQVDVSEGVASIAENAGLLFGYVGKNVKAANLSVKAAKNQIIKADVYGGVVAANNLGTISAIEIDSSNIDGFSGFFDFNLCKPTALGNIVGLMEGGQIENATVVANLKAKIDVESLGGAVGELTAGVLKDVIVVGTLNGGSRIGGVVGRINRSNNATVTIQNCFHSGNITSSSSSEVVTIGTLIGVVSNYKSDDINNKIIILFKGDFEEDINKKLESGEFAKPKVDVTTFATSALTEIWVCAICGEGADNTRTNQITTDGIYSVNEEDITEYAPIASSYKLNGKVVQKA